MGKIARELASAPDENLVPAGARRPFKADEWQGTDSGDFINTKTGEVVDSDELERMARQGAADDNLLAENPFDDDDYSQVPRGKGKGR